MLAIKFRHLICSSLLLNAYCSALKGKPGDIIKHHERALLQDLVTWDDHSLSVCGNRVMLFSGEFHPFRLPVPGLWLDVFQKIRALGYIGVSFYVDWALLEGKPGSFSAEGIFDLGPFFDAAQTAGVYLLARPGPYINAETSGGGYPGWLQRIKGGLRTSAPDYLNATNLYVSSIGKIIADAQITNGGPVILLQPENEFSVAAPGLSGPDPVYFGHVEEQYRNAGIVVPFINNDGGPYGNFAPPNVSAVDIYGHDWYPLGFTCEVRPLQDWAPGDLPTNFRALHEAESPTTPYAIVEFQGGSSDPWGGWGPDQCALRLNQEFERVFYKNDFSFGITILNLYMTYGGTNWGNLGFAGGYTSYDYGAVIAEDRTITREKYSEAKLEATFLTTTPNYVVATPENASNGTYTDTDALTVTPLFGESGNLFVVRHANYSTQSSTQYRLTIPTKIGNVTVPQLNGTLTLHGRDSKIHVSDYDLNGTLLLYSSAEIFSWQKYPSKTNGSDFKTVMVVYGGAEEQHEMAFSNIGEAEMIHGSGVSVNVRSGHTILNWKTNSEQRVVRVGNVFVYILDRNTAYNYWVVKPPSSADKADPLIIEAGYLMRNASINEGTLALVGDLNRTTEISVIGGAPSNTTTLTWNGEAIDFQQDEYGVITATTALHKPNFTIPDLHTVQWNYIDALPEIQSNYDDSLWTSASNTTTPNPQYNMTTPTSLSASDYGYHTGSLLYRGHFTATGTEFTISLFTQGGAAFGMSAFLNSSFLGSHTGSDASHNSNNTFALPALVSGEHYVFTVVIDHMGLNETSPGRDQMKEPRGLLDYRLRGRSQSDVEWKITGNLGGEDYRDAVRGPLNEGALFPERQGFHLPSPPVSQWNSSRSPTDGITTTPGIGFFVTRFELHMPKGYDIPLSIRIANTTASEGKAPAFRMQIFVNGYQFGKYVNNIGPQTVFPVPQGIWDYDGMNWLAISFWGLEAGAGKVGGLELLAGEVVQSGYGDVPIAPMSRWMVREGAY